MIEEQCTRWLQSSGLFSQVTQRGMLADPQYLLQGNVVLLHGDYRDRTQPQAVLEIQILLIDDTGREPLTLIHRNYRQEVPISNRSAEELVRGFSQALRLILTELEEELRGML